MSEDSVTPDNQEVPKKETAEELRARQTSYLKPVKPGEVRNPAGRKKGSQNVATVIKKWLKASEKLPDSKELPAFLKKGIKVSQLDLMILAQIQKARNGDTQSFNALLDRSEGKLVQKQLHGSDPENPLPETTTRQVFVMPNGDEIPFE